MKAMPSGALNGAFFSSLVAAVGGEAHACKLLAVHRTTLRRWMAGGRPPVAAMRALYWESSMGQEALRIDEGNREMWWRGQVRALSDERRRLLDEIDRLQALSGFGSANGPLFQPARNFKARAPVIPLPRRWAAT